MEVPKLSLKQKVIGGVAAITMTGIGAFSTSVFKSAGDSVGDNFIKPMVKEAAEKQQHTTTSQPLIAASEPLRIMESSTFEQDYQACYDKTVGNPNIDPNDITAVYQANIYCLLTEKNQGAELDKRAQTDENLKAILDKIRNP